MADLAVEKTHSPANKKKQVYGTDESLILELTKSANNVCPNRCHSSEFHMVKQSKLSYDY